MVLLVNSGKYFSLKNVSCYSAQVVSGIVWKRSAIHLPAYSLPVCQCLYLMILLSLLGPNNTQISSIDSRFPWLHYACAVHLIALSGAIQNGMWSCSLIVV